MPICSITEAAVRYHLWAVAAEPQLRSLQARALVDADGGLPRKSGMLPILCVVPIVPAALVNIYNIAAAHR